MEDWLAHASTVRRQEDADGALLLPWAAFGALGMHGPHWRAFKDNPSLQGRSEVLLRARFEVRRFMRFAGEAAARGVLWVSRLTHRVVTNEDEALAALAARCRANESVRAVHLGRMSYAQQFEAVSGAALVVGMHGGGMWNAARWMSRPQKMLEIMPVLGPGATCSLAKMMGIGYGAVVCAECVEATGHSGRVPVRELAETAAALLDAETLAPDDCRLI